MANQSIAKRLFRLCSADGWVSSAKVVLLLLVVLIAITPLTQMIWSNDNLLHGHDTETSLALVFTFILLFLLRVHNTRGTVACLLSRIPLCLAACFGIRRSLTAPGVRRWFRRIAPSGPGKPGAYVGFQPPLLV